MSSPLASTLTFLGCFLAASISAGAAPKKRVPPKAEPAAPAALLDPVLEPHAERYDANLVGLKATRVVEIKQRRAAYLAELDAALTKIPAGTDVPLTDLLRKERAGVADGLVVPANPTGLPPEIQTARKLFFNKIEFASMTFAAEKKKLDDAYIKLLTVLARQTRSDKAMVARIAAEKRRVLTVQ
jgi:hypothetical protein